MKDIIRMSDWEYLGTIVQGGVEYVALQPLAGAGGVRFFSCEAGEYRRVEDPDTERAVSRLFRRAALERQSEGLREAR